MSEEILAKAHEVLDNYMESNHHRRTPERSTILDTIYSMGEHFSIEDLGRELLKKNFRVSRATLYNTLHLFLELRLVVKHSLADGTKYEASYSDLRYRVRVEEQRQLVVVGECGFLHWIPPL